MKIVPLSAFFPGLFFVSLSPPYMPRIDRED
jgi:hypothetical protein